MKYIKCLIFIVFFIPAFANAERWFVDKGGYFSKGTGAVILGYDPVSYFTAGKAIKGDPKINFDYEGGTFFFSSQENLNLFKSNPKNYEPQYGGFCAYAVGAKNSLVKADPTVWKIVEGKLYLNYNDSIQKIWAEKMSDYISKGNLNWPSLEAKTQE